MNRRLQRFLDDYELTPARFADSMGVQRSGISHILSGRNKPGYDFIEKFLTKYPNVNAEWLITGKGKPYKDAVSTEPSPVRTQENTNYVTENKEDRINFNEEYPSEDTKIDTVVTSAPKEKGVKRITLFYSDGSFEEFFPHR